MKNTKKINPVLMLIIGLIIGGVSSYFMVSSNHEMFQGKIDIYNDSSQKISKKSIDSNIYQDYTDTNECNETTCDIIKLMNHNQLKPPPSDAGSLFDADGERYRSGYNLDIIAQMIKYGCPANWEDFPETYDNTYYPNTFPNDAPPEININIGE